MRIHITQHRFYGLFESKNKFIVILISPRELLLFNGLYGNWPIYCLLLNVESFWTPISDLICL